MRDAILKLLPADRYVHFLDIADEIEGVPWEVHDALEALVNDNLAECATGGKRLAFRRKYTEAASRKARRSPFKIAIEWLQGVFQR
jgi:hypothetical protein